MVAPVKPAPTTTQLLDVFMLVRLIRAIGLVVGVFHMGSTETVSMDASKELAVDQYRDATQGLFSRLMRVCASMSCAPSVIAVLKSGFCEGNSPLSANGI
ncbi:hypothetical protein GCM10010214_12150 [Streptomyces abikoensis]|nr:hypothetical protein GCM10010214_12150 [Streptomyces abikoensis]